jgi:hypothetical protein
MRGRSAGVRLQEDVSENIHSPDNLLALINKSYFYRADHDSMMLFHDAITKHAMFTDWKSIMPHFFYPENKHAWVSFVISSFYESSAIDALNENVQYSEEILAIITI